MLAVSFQWVPASHMCATVSQCRTGKGQSILSPTGQMVSSLAGTQRPAHQHENHPRDELQGHASRRHHERQAVEHRHRGLRTHVSAILQNVALHVHRLHPQHVEQEHGQEQAGCGVIESVRETQTVSPRPRATPEECSSLLISAVTTTAVFTPAVVIATVLQSDMCCSACWV